MELKDIKAVYFVGAGGIGMSAIARYFLKKGIVVAGYDKTPSDLTRHLEKEGMLIHYEEDVEQIPAPCKKQNECLVIYTPAIPAEHKELIFFRENHFEIQKRAQVLGTLTQAHKGLCVAGTHGKTTTSTMCAHIMHLSHLDCNAFLGGISKNYGTNYILSNSDYVVIEADEFDRSFHWLRPWMSVITSTDPDHLDIYGTKEAYLESFRHYSELIQPGGALIIHRDLEMKEHLQDGVQRYDYSLDKGDFHAENIRIDNGEITFDFISPIECVKDIQLGQPIPINIENGIAAMAMAQLNGCTAEELKHGMQTYGGVDRRFDFKIKTDNLVFLSDYAHHPKEIYQSARSIRELYKDKHGFVIGGMDGLRYQEYVLQIHPGDKVFVYTDGVPEATNADKELFGTERLVDALNEQPQSAPFDILKNVRRAVDDFVQEAEQFDDLTMLCLEYKGR